MPAEFETTVLDNAEVAIFEQNCWLKLNIIVYIMVVVEVI